MLGHRHIMYKNTGPKLHMSISWSLIVFPTLLIKGIPSSLWWGEQCVCKDPEPIKHFLQSWSTHFQHTETLTGKRGYKAPCPRWEGQNTGDRCWNHCFVNGFLLSGLLFQCWNRKASCYRFITELQSPSSSQNYTRWDLHKGVSNRPMQSLQSFKS